MVESWHSAREGHRILAFQAPGRGLKSAATPGRRQRRDVRHVDRVRVELGRASIGAASWCHLFGGLFGDPNAVLHGDTARVINFPARRVKSGNSDGRC